MKQLLAITLVILVACVTALAQVPKGNRFEDFTTDPGWLGEGNIMPPSNTNVSYGFSNTTNINPTAGEAGGRFDRTGTDINSYYGDDLELTLTLDDKMEASGQFLLLPAAQIATEMTLGFFDRSVGFRPANTSNSVVGIQMDFTRWRAVGDFPDQPESGIGWVNGPASATVFSFSITYDPGLGAFGRITATLAGETSSRDITTLERNSGATFNTFGLQALADGQPPLPFREADVYIDDVTYTVGATDISFDTVTVEDTTAMQFLSIIDALHHLEFTTDLVAPTNWVPTGATITGNGGTMLLFDPTGTDTSKIYRILMTP